MRIQDYHDLPKLRDSLSYLYLEHGVVERAQNAVEFFDKASGRTLIPAASLTTLMLGPGTSITHEAVKTLADNGCLILWCGEEGVRFYAQGMGETRKAYHLLRQAEKSSDPIQRMEVILRMYRFRFGEELDDNLTLEQIRGHEGVRVRKAYAEAAKTSGIKWEGRNYDRGNWGAADPVNRALSAANACLNGLCHAAIVSGGYSPGLGFIHTGKQLSFVYDIADLYKVDITVPLAFRLTAEGAHNLESRVRHTCRDAFHAYNLLDHILPDIDQLLGISDKELAAGAEADADLARPEPWWSPDDLTEAGGDDHARDDVGDSAGWAAR
ncbi:MAG: subtype I-E CRISPR-associated endonuclease Cas1 [Anaerolineae bacterium CG2_30_64_16]|nr:MAG: subtype I-E CRISPR-associated endonuclease Cas1 [Anaerolineae bacterium CG2_30_64_16]